MQIGDIYVKQAVLLAPMENVTDIAFRLICKRFGADVMYTEFVNVQGLAHNSEKTKHKMIFFEEERPFGIQIYGGEGAALETAARMAEELHPDLVEYEKLNEPTKEKDRANIRAIQKLIVAGKLTVVK